MMSIFFGDDFLRQCQLRARFDYLRLAIVAIDTRAYLSVYKPERGGTRVPSQSDTFDVAVTPQATELLSRGRCYGSLFPNRLFIS